MRDRACPVRECTATVRFDGDVVEVTPRFQLHDLGEVDEFAVCPDCDAEVAGFYEDDGDEDGNVELILDIDGDDVDDADEDATDAGGAATDSFDDPPGGFDDEKCGFDAATDDFDDPEDVLSQADDADAEDEAADDDTEDESAAGDEHEPVFGASDDE